MSKIAIMKELWDFLKVRKKYWLVPVLIMMLLLSALLILTENSPIASLIYTLF